jgi:hypothetical protein
MSVYDTFAGDADLTHPWVAKYRIPMITSHRPVWRYEVALVVPGDPFNGPRFTVVMPTDEEAAIIGAAIDHRRNWYNETYKAKKLGRPLDVDGSVNTFIFVKHSDGWRYRYDSWRSGVMFAPSSDTDPRHFTPDAIGLVKMLSEVIFGDSEGPRPDWAAFMDSRPEVFAAYRPEVASP